MSALLLCFILSSCSDVHLLQPIANNHNAVIDTALTGLWRFEGLDHQQNGYFLIGLNGSKWYHIINFDINRHHLLQLGKLDSFQVTQIKGITYISYSAMHEYNILSCTFINDSTLAIYIPNENFLKKNIRNKKLGATHKIDSVPVFKQSVVRDTNFTITMSTHELQNFFSRAKHDSAFIYIGNLVRILN